jgi:hypothetical protein
MPVIASGSQENVPRPRDGTLELQGNP